MRINEAARKTVMFIGVKNSAGQFTPYGSAFIGQWNEDGVNLSYLITAKHVVENMTGTGLQFVGRLNHKNGQAIVGVLQKEEWQFHPSIPKCDLAIAEFTASYETYDIKGVDLNNGCLTQEYIEANDIGAGSDVFTTGLLTSHVGAQKNIPVVRSGNIAAMPEEAVYLGPRLGHQEVYLIESRSIGGLSGSPVFLNTPPVRFVRGDAVLTGGHHTQYLIGVNIGLFETKAHGDAIPTEKAKMREEFLETMSAGIAIVVPIKRAIEIISGSVLFRKHRSDIKASVADSAAPTHLQTADLP